MGKYKELFGKRVRILGKLLNIIYKWMFDNWDISSLKKLMINFYFSGNIEVKGKIHYTQKTSVKPPWKLMLKPHWQGYLYL